MPENCTHDCSTCGESCSERQEPQSLLKEHHPEAHIGKVFGIVWARAPSPPPWP